MTDNREAQPAQLIPAATTLLVRDGETGIEVFMVVRNRSTDRFSGALVFPGGKVEPRDSDEGLREYCRVESGEGGGELSLRVAAIREAFEESGVLLARYRNSGLIPDGQQMAELEGYRAELEQDHTTLLTLVREEGLELATDLLVPFSRWLTPPVPAKRFDTHFFVAKVPVDYRLLHCGRETVDSVWSSPQQLLADAETGRWDIVFPTRANLSRLGTFADTAELLRVSAEQRLDPVTPNMERREDGTLLSIPADAGFPIHQQFLAR